jgi:uncharacterized protein (TIGR00369 family)
MSRPFPVPIPFVSQLGFELLHFDEGRAEIAVRIDEALTNSWGVAHGGLLMTLLDVAMAHAARSPLRAGGEPYPGVVTIEMKTSFVRPGLGRVVAHAGVLHRTPTMAFTEGRVLDVGGGLVAHASGTFKYLHGLPAGPDGRRIRRLGASD